MTAPTPYAQRAAVRHRARRDAWRAAGRDPVTYRRIMRRWLRSTHRAAGTMPAYRATLRAWHHTRGARP